MSDETLNRNYITGHCRQCGVTFEITDDNVQRRLCLSCERAAAARLLRGMRRVGLVGAASRVAVARAASGALARWRREVGQ